MNKQYPVDAVEKMAVVEAQLGRPLDPAEREIAMAIVNHINQAYWDGFRAGAEAAMEEYDDV